MSLTNDFKIARPINVALEPFVGGTAACVGDTAACVGDTAGGVVSWRHVVGLVPSKCANTCNDHQEHLGLGHVQRKAAIQRKSTFLSELNRQAPSGEV